jgi:hypothetical protein
MLSGFNQLLIMAYSGKDRISPLLIKTIFRNLYYFEQASRSFPFFPLKGIMAITFDDEQRHGIYDYSKQQFSPADNR